MSPATRRTPRRRHGAAAELTVTLPRLVSMLPRILEMGRVLEIQQILGAGVHHDDERRHQRLPDRVTPRDLARP
ncbi:MAG TPA: hypothetical protein VG406_27495 [Isosphaeraceae bacterium]|jgi:hypothetical protein|nr:hypothetical protein [Isosphaeraceae bacterium]